jgi:hypothetical protein
MRSTELRQLIRESINEYIRDIDEAGNKAALDAKMTATQEAIDLREKKMNMDGLDEAYHDMLDKGKVKELGGEVKALKKSLDKLKKQLDKLNSKGTKTEKPESEEKEIVDEIEIDETFPESGSQLEEDNDEMDIYESLHMQKLAGIISESEYVDKVKKAKVKKALVKKKLNEDLKFGQVEKDRKYTATEDFGIFKKDDEIFVNTVRNLGTEVVLELSNSKGKKDSIKGDLGEEVEVFNIF